MSWIHLSPASVEVETTETGLEPTHGTINAEKPKAVVGEPVKFTLVVYFNRTVSKEDAQRLQLHFKGTINKEEVPELDKVYSLYTAIGNNFFKSSFTLTFNEPGEYMVGGMVRLEPRMGG